MFKNLLSLPQGDSLLESQNNQQF